MHHLILDTLTKAKFIVTVSLKEMVYHMLEMGTNKLEYKGTNLNVFNAEAFL